jgi:hypothetical protein
MESRVAIVPDISDVEGGALLARAGSHVLPVHRVGAAHAYARADSTAGVPREEHGLVAGVVVSPQDLRLAATLRKPARSTDLSRGGPRPYRYNRPRGARRADVRTPPGL